MFSQQGICRGIRGYLFHLHIYFNLYAEYPQAEEKLDFNLSKELELTRKALNLPRSFEYRCNRQKIQPIKKFQGWFYFVGPAFFISGGNLISLFKNHLFFSFYIDFQHFILNYFIIYKNL